MKIKSVLLLCCVAQVYANTSFSQQTKLDVDYQNSTIISILDDLKSRTDYMFVYQEDAIPKDARVSAKLKDASIETILNEVLVKNGYEYSVKGQVIVINKMKRQPAQQPQLKTITVSGRITDDKGNAIAGASIVVHGTTHGTASDAQGRYALRVEPDDVLKISYVGYKEEIVAVKGKTTQNVALSPSVEKIEEVTVVAFGEQKKESMVSAITSVKASDLKTSNSDLTASFAGRIPSIIGWQTGGLPGALTEEEMNTKFYIRGITSFGQNANIDPLILLDGVEASKLDLSRMPVEDIESFSVMKDAAATAMYGARGANGVILITTKKGQEGSVYTTFRYEAIASMPTQTIDVVDPITYMQMFNQALTTRDNLISPKYSAEHINRTVSGDYPSWVYPANDWYDTLFKKFNVNHHFGLSLRGGSKTVQYYASVTHNRDQGMLKTDRLNDFDVNVKNNNTVFRINLNVNLAPAIKLVVTSSTSLDKYHGPLESASEAYYLMFRASPVDYAPLYPADDQYSWPHLRFGGLLGANNTNNPYKLLHRGYLDRNRYSTINRAEYIHNLSSLLKGLELRASVSLNQGGYSSIGYVTVPFEYSLQKYDFETGKHILRANNPTQARRTLAIDNMSTSTTSSTQITYEAVMMHTAAWGGSDGNKHQTALTAAFQAQDRVSRPASSVLNSFNYRNLGFSMRGTYGLKDRYFAEASFGYNGSERFAKKNRMGFFPAAGLAWVISKEEFMQSISKTVPFLKLRVSYGKVGNDGITDKPRFVYLPELEKRWDILDPEFGGRSSIKRYGVVSYTDENIKWEVAEQVNFGLDVKLFSGIVDITFDAYQEIRHNILSSRTIIPSSMGIEYAPLANIGKVRSRGFDFQGKIQHAFTPGYWFILTGTATYSKATYLEIEEALDKPEWQTRKGQDISQRIGYIAEGLFKDQAEIDNSPVQGGNVMPGDIRYRDLNGDGKIDVYDATYIGYPETPRFIYGFHGFVNLKNFEFSFAFQGSSKRSFFIDPRKISPFAGQQAMLKAIYNDHWSEDNMSDRPFWPRLSTNNIIAHNPQENWDQDKEETRRSTYFMRECTFLRCTSLELAYNMPESVVKRFKLQSVKFYVRANNPFIFSDFNIWDVELGSSGFNYPIQKTYSIGVNVSF